MLNQPNMRKLTVALTGLPILMLSFFLSSCKKDETDELSRVKNYPAIILKGAALSSINLNDTYTDPGAVATLNGSNITPLVSGAVNNRALGFYTITYRGANTEGDTVAATRVVAVVDPSVNSLDQSGTFLRAANGATAKVTKIGNGLYQTDNLGGVVPPSSAIQPAYFAQVTPTRIVFPAQTAPGIGAVSFSGPAAVFDAAGLLTQFSYAVINPGFGTANRVFTRQ
jgi:hypothetical protein